MASTAALNTILLLSLAPLAIVALSWLTPGERICRLQALGLLTSLDGAAVLILRGDATALFALRPNAGDLWMLVAVGLWAIYSVLLKRRPAETPPPALHTASVAAGTLWMLPLFGALLAITFLGEQLAAHHFIGAALVLGGVVLTSRR